MRAEVHRRRVGRVLATSACIATAAGAVAGCGDISQSSSSSSASATVAADTPAALVPSSVRSTGTLVIGTNIPYPPMEMFKANHQTPTGADIDLITAIAHGLGLKPKIVNMNYDGLIPAVNSGRLDLVISGMGDFTDREKQLNFVDYIKTGSEIVMTKAQAASSTSLLSLCGKSMAIQEGTDQVAATTIASKRCVAAGKPPIPTKTFPEDTDAMLAQESGRVQMHATDSPVAQYEAATIDGGKRMVAKFPNFLSTPVSYGIGIARSDMGLARAVRNELNVLIKNGTYGKILARYHLQSLAVPSAVINGATVSSTGVQ